MQDYKQNSVMCVTRVKLEGTNLSLDQNSTAKLIAQMVHIHLKKLIHLVICLRSKV